MNTCGARTRVYFSGRDHQLRESAGGKQAPGFEDKLVDNLRAAGMTMGTGGSVTTDNQVEQGRNVKSESLWRGDSYRQKGGHGICDAWQVGMYGWMAIVHFGMCGEIPKANPMFWFMMQIAMAAGFLTSYPLNWSLLKAGLNEKM